MKEKKQITSDDYYKKLNVMTKSVLKTISETPEIGFDFDKATLEHKTKLSMDIREILTNEMNRHYNIICKTGIDC